MTNWIKKKWWAGALVALCISGFALASGVTYVAEARADVPVLVPLSATGPHVAAWVLAAPAVAVADQGAVVTTPAPIIIPDPVDNPNGFWDLILWAKKNGWPLAIAVIIAGVAATVGKRWRWLVQEGTRRAAIVGSVSMLGAATVEALISGSWAPVAVALIAAIFWVVDPKKKPAEAEVADK
jgi:hypothetical protein